MFLNKLGVKITLNHSFTACKGEFCSYDRLGQHGAAVGEGRMVRIQSYPSSTLELSAILNTNFFGPSRWYGTTPPNTSARDGRLMARHGPVLIGRRRGPSRLRNGMGFGMV